MLEVEMDGGNGLVTHLSKPIYPYEGCLISINEAYESIAEVKYVWRDYLLCSAINPYFQLLCLVRVIDSFAE